MADQTVVRDWLKALGTLVAGSLPPNEVRAKLALLAPMLADEFPVAAFCPVSLAAVARQCKFFPSYAEICEVLSPWWRENRPPLTAIASDQAATVRQRAIERECRESWEGVTAEQVRAKIRDLDSHPFRLLLGRMLATALRRHAATNLGLLPPEFLEVAP